MTQDYYEEQARDAFNILKQYTDICDYIRDFNDPNGFMWAPGTMINRISNLLQHQGHSGASFALTLRWIQKELKNTQNNQLNITG